MLDPVRLVSRVWTAAGSELFGCAYSVWYEVRVRVGSTVRSCELP